MSDLHHPPHPDPTQQLTQRAYYQLVHTLTSLLPPPLADTHEALCTRNDAAIAKVAALLPVNADEADIAAHRITARAQAEDVLRLLRQHAGDINLVMKLNAQFALVERTAASIRTQLLRVQTARHKREKDGGTAANAEEWTGYIAARQMQQALDQAAALAAPAAEQSPPATSRAPAPAPAVQPLLPAMPAAPATTLPPSPAPAAPRPTRQRPHSVAEADEPPRDLAAEADYYATVYPYRAAPIQQHGGLPPNCDFGPPDDDLLHAIVTGTSRLYAPSTVPPPPPDRVPTAGARHGGTRPHPEGKALLLGAA